jgi:nicotinamidase-related amidase
LPHIHAGSHFFELLQVYSLRRFAILHGIKKHGKMKKALVIVDIQNDYFKGGAYALDNTENAGENAMLLLNEARKNKIHIVHIRHESVNAGAEFFLPETQGAAIHDLVRPIEHETIITKHYPNSFRDTDLLPHLHQKGITELIICGMQTDVCIAATVRAAKDFNFAITVVGDACATRDRELYGNPVKAEEVQRSYLAGFTALGNFYAEVITTDQFLNGN